MRLSGHGLRVELPAGWEGRIYRRPEGRAILHAGNFPLPSGDGDFGSLAVPAMAPDGVFLVLAEYDPALAGRGLFARRGIPAPLRSSEADPRAMPRAVPMRAGIQRFFSERGRAFCLYVVVGTRAGAAEPVRRANDVLATVAISPAGDPGSP